MDAVVYHNWGRWVADCPQSGCPNAEHYGEPSGSPRGGLELEWFRCSFCGWTGRAVWPDNLSGIEKVLRLRPVPSTRNWLPGETVETLVAENLEHGIGVS